VAGRLAVEGSRGEAVVAPVRRQSPPVDAHRGAVQAYRVAVDTADAHRRPVNAVDAHRRAVNADLADNGRSATNWPAVTGVSVSYRYEPGSGNLLGAVGVR